MYRSLRKPPYWLQGRPLRHPPPQSLLPYWPAGPSLQCPAPSDRLSWLLGHPLRSRTTSLTPRLLGRPPWPSYQLWSRAPGRTCRHHHPGLRTSRRPRTPCRPSLTPSNCRCSHYWSEPPAGTSTTTHAVWVPRRSTRLAAKSAFRDPQPEKQARRVLPNKWAGLPEDVVSNTPDATVAVKFHEAFTEPLSSSKREAMRELFPKWWPPDTDRGAAQLGPPRLVASSLPP